MLPKIINITKRPMAEAEAEDSDQSFQSVTTNENITNYQLELEVSPRRAATKSLRTTTTQLNKQKKTSSPLRTSLRLAPPPVTSEIPSTSKYKSKRKSIPKKKKQFHVLDAIRHYQTVTNSLIPKAPFARIIREVLQQLSYDFRISMDALNALQEATEIYLTQLFQDAYQCCLYRGRVTLAVKDIEIVRYIRGVQDPGCVK